MSEPACQALLISDLGDLHATYLLDPNRLAHRPVLSLIEAAPPLIGLEDPEQCPFVALGEQSRLTSGEEGVTVPTAPTLRAHVYREDLTPTSVRRRIGMTETDHPPRVLGDMDPVPFPDESPPPACP